DGSPIKTTGTKDGSKRVAFGSENVGPSQKPGGSPVSAMKKPTTDANAEGDGKPKSDDPEDCHLRDLYTQISEVVAANPDKLKIINEDETEDPSAVPMIWISKWVDYSDKYGLGYQLSDDSIGVLFNDFTKLLLLPDGENIHYIERNGQEHYHRLSDFPQSICKKVTLLRYFRNYMNEHLLKAGATMAPREGDELARIPSLKTYFRTRSAIVLHLTNGTLQINFFEDHTKIILCPLMGAVTYIDKKRSFRTYRLEMIKKYGCTTDLADRLKYGRNMIQKLLLNKSGSSSRGIATTVVSIVTVSSHQSAQPKPMA
ncbi:Serine/threonine-protein kinase PLK1, partial [Armadillidium vulgare]